MRLNDYQREALRTATRSLDAYTPIVRKAALALPPAECDEFLRLQDIHTWAHGLAGEAGEVCDLLKKVHGHGTPYDAEKLKKELGDTLWYLASLCTVHGFTLEEVAQGNIAKLRARHPKGFSVASANAKADEKCSRRLGAGTCQPSRPCKRHGCERSVCLCSRAL
jgi:NTP pyrophosphatase (non-canonical NTP hydrolase)